MQALALKKTDFVFCDIITLNSCVMEETFLTRRLELDAFLKSTDELINSKYIIADIKIGIEKTTPTKLDGLKRIDIG